MDSHGTQNENQNGRPQAGSLSGFQQDKKSEGARGGKETPRISRWVRIGQVSKSVLEIAVSITALVGLYLVYQQLGVSQEANRLTQDSNALTRDALADSRKQYQESRADSAEDARKAEERFKESLDAARESAAAEQRLSRQSLAESKRTLEVSQRAYLVVDSIDVSVSSPWVGTVFIRNSGHLPATEVRWSVAFDEKPTSTFLPQLEVAPAGWGYQVMDSRTVVGGGSMFPIKVRGSTLQAPSNKEPSIPFLHGVLGYLDGFGHDRRTRFCFFNNPMLKDRGWYPCFKEAIAE